MATAPTASIDGAKRHWARCSEAPALSGALTRFLSRRTSDWLGLRDCLCIDLTILHVQVSAVIDVDVVPETLRRVRLCKHGSSRPLGFYIRDGTSVRVTKQGVMKQAGVFISRLMPGGLAASTGLLALNDEVLEVNGSLMRHYHRCGNEQHLIDHSTMQELMLRARRSTR